MNPRSFLITFFITFFTVTTVFAQTTFQGVISDSLDQPIPNVQVLLKKTVDDQIIAATYSDVDGVYSLKVDQSRDYKLRFNSLNHEAVTFPVHVKDADRDTVITINVVLEHKPVTFDEEIIVEAEPPISVEGDTISYRVEDFLLGDETVAEDVLQRLPGIHVDDEGVVRFAGKKVEKVMVEDADLFGRGYSLVTKNLDASYIDKVEVLQRYTETPELRDLEHSDKVALNLSLKDDAKTGFFGNATLGVNTSSDYGADLVLMSLSSSLNHYLFFNSNSLGREPVGEIEQFVRSSPIQDESSGLLGYNTTPVLHTRERALEFDESRLRFNNSHLASYNIIYNPNETVELKWTNFATVENDRFWQESIRSYTEGDVNFQETDDFNLTDRFNNVFSRIRTTVVPGENSRFVFEGTYNHHTGNGETDKVFNRVISTESRDNTDRNASGYLQYTNRFSENSAVTVTSTYEYDDLTESFKTAPFFPEELFNGEQEISNARQRISQQVQLYSLQAESISKLSRNVTMEANAGISFSGMNIQSDLSFNDYTENNIASDCYQNKLSLNNSNPFVGVAGRYYLGEESSLFTGVKYHHLSYELNYLNNSVADQHLVKKIEPRVGLELKINRKNQIRATYMYNATPVSLQDMMDGFVYTGNRIFTRGLGSFEIFRNHSYFFNYSYGSWLENILINATLFYRKSKEHPATRALITPDYNLMGRRIGMGQSFLNAKLSADIFLRFIKNNLKVITNFSSVDSENEINSNLISINSNFSKIGLEFRSVFDGFLNYNIGSSWSIQEITTTVPDRKIDQFQFLDLYLDFSDRISTVLTAERHYFDGLKEKNSWYFLDGSVKYEIRPNELELSLEANNITNNENFARNQLTDIGSTITRYRVVPRYLLIRLNYRI